MYLKCRTTQKKIKSNFVTFFLTQEVEHTFSKFLTEAFSPAPTHKYENSVEFFKFEMFYEKNQNNMLGKYQTSCMVSLSQADDLHAFIFYKKTIKLVLIT
jgi:hypothetical protein